MSWTIKSSWYRPPSLRTHLNEMEWARREAAFYKWYDEKFKRDYKHPESVTQPVARETILNPLKVIGQIDERNVTVRKVAFRGESDQSNFEYREITYKHGPSAQPPLYVVAWGGKRIDSFLSSKVATQFAKDLIKLNGGENV